MRLHTCPIFKYSGNSVLLLFVVLWHPLLFCSPSFPTSKKTGVGLCPLPLPSAYLKSVCIPSSYYVMYCSSAYYYYHYCTRCTLYWESVRILLQEEEGGKEKTQQLWLERLTESVVFSVPYCTFVHAVHAKFEFTYCTVLHTVEISLRFYACDLKGFKGEDRALLFGLSY